MRLPGGARVGQEPGGGLRSWRGKARYAAVAALRAESKPETRFVDRDVSQMGLLLPRCTVKSAAQVWAAISPLGKAYNDRTHVEVPQRYAAGQKVNSRVWDTVICVQPQKAIHEVPLTPRELKKLFELDSAIDRSVGNRLRSRGGLR